MCSCERRASALIRAISFRSLRLFSMARSARLGDPHSPFSPKARRDPGVCNDDLNRAADELGVLRKHQAEAAVRCVEIGIADLFDPC